MDKLESEKRQTELAGTLLRYFAQTYGKKVWLKASGTRGKGYLVWFMDFSTDAHHPATAEALPKHERYWFLAAAMYDPTAYRALTKGGPYYLSVSPHPRYESITDDYQVMGVV